jgi:alkylhydroperoxidase family enzyme
MPPRLEQLPPETTPELADEFASFIRSLGFVPNSVLTMQRQPALVRAFVTLQSAIWNPESKVDRGLKRLIAHIASRAAGDAYSMAHTASGALHFGISEAKLAAASDYASSPLFNAAERAALVLAEASASTPNAVSDEMMEELRRHWSDEQVVEIVAAIATAAFVNRWNTTMLTPLEPEPRAVGERLLAPQGWTRGRH